MAGQRQPSSNPAPGQPMPRMTDSMTPSQAGPGPSSFKLAALSANSYHLDSPPFTGIAGPLEASASADEYVSAPATMTAPGSKGGGGGSVGVSSGTGVGVSASAQQSSVSSSSSSSRSLESAAASQRSGLATESGGATGAAGTAALPVGTTVDDASSARTSLSGGGTPRVTDHHATAMTNASSTSASSADALSHARRSRADVDVPLWRLDEARRASNAMPSTETTGTNNVDEDTTLTDLTPSNEYGPPHHSSLSPPPFSSSGPGPLWNNGYHAHPHRSNSNEQHSDAVRRSPRKREASRPTFTQTSDMANAHLVEDAASSAAGEGGSDGGAADSNDGGGGGGGGGLGNAVSGWMDGDGDGDADADDSLHPPDGEVDGDEGAFVLRSNTTNGTSVRTMQKRMPQQSQTLDEYRFPRHRLPTRMRNESKIPLVIVACGSFSPPTYLHLRIFEMAKDQVIESGKYELLGGYYSPVSDYYKKEGLAKATHRVRMCELAVEKTSTWLMVDAWESLQNEYQRTAVVLDHFDEEINGGAEGGILTSDGTRRKVRIMLLAGGDLIQSMGEPGVWADVDLHHILGKYGCMIVERTGADVWSFLLSHDLLWRYRKNLKIVKQTIFNDISSSKVRLFVRRGQSIKYLLPNSVIHYIEQHQLYRLPKELDTEPPDADLQHF